MVQLASLSPLALWITPDYTLREDRRVEVLGGRLQAFSIHRLASGTLTRIVEI